MKPEKKFPTVFYIFWFCFHGYLNSCNHFFVAPIYMSGNILDSQALFQKAWQNFVATYVLIKTVS